MKLISKSRSILAMCILVALLIPMLALTAYASEKEPYYYYFKDGFTPKAVSGTKDDVGDPDGSGKFAGVSILGGQFNDARVRYWLLGPDGSQVAPYTGWKGSAPQNMEIRYFDGANLYNGCSVTLMCEAEYGVEYVWGNFQP